MSDSLLLSICIPYYGKPPTVLKDTVESAARQLPASSELLVLPDGPEASAALEQVGLLGDVQIVRSDRRIGLVRNWNRCLSVSQGELVHILHDDDVVASGFYESILALRRRFPAAGLYATGKTPLNSDVTLAANVGDSFLLTGDPALLFIQQDDRYSVGSVVLTRAAVARTGPFRSDFPYCPDEEAFPRYATGGGFAFDPRPLYRVRGHGQQTRYSTWRRPDFVSTYIRSRVEGATNFSPAMVNVSLDSSARRVISIAISLAMNGERTTALARLNDLAFEYPPSRTWSRMRLARVACRSGVFLRAVALRRKHRCARAR
jgi:hypothetical protein